MVHGSTAVASLLPVCRSMEHDLVSGDDFGVRAVCVICPHLASAALAAGAVISNMFCTLDMVRAR